MKKNKYKRKLKMVKDTMHMEYDHELYKFQHKKRYVKEDIKKFKNKRDRRKSKVEIKKGEY